VKTIEMILENARGTTLRYEAAAPAPSPEPGLPGMGGPQ
jgi:hypothetical protein